jgi:hypothetical protein
MKEVTVEVTINSLLEEEENYHTSQDVNDPNQAFNQRTIYVQYL